MDIHNGHSVRFWLDLWHPPGRLIEIVGDQGRLKLGTARNICISDVMVGNDWNFRNTRDRNVQSMIRQVKEFHVTLEENVEDAVLWKAGDQVYGKQFSVHSTWEMIRARREEVVWHKLVWYVQGVPRYAFITWLAVKEKLSTGVKMRAWGRFKAICSVESRNNLETTFILRVLTPTLFGWRS